MTGSCNADKNMNAKYMTFEELHVKLPAMKYLYLTFLA